MWGLCGSCLGDVVLSGPVVKKWSNLGQLACLEKVCVVGCGVLVDGVSSRCLGDVSIGWYGWTGASCSEEVL